METIINSFQEQEYAGFNYVLSTEENNLYNINFLINNDIDGVIYATVTIYDDGYIEYNYSYNEDFSRIYEEEFEEWFERNLDSILNAIQQGTINELEYQLD